MRGLFCRIIIAGCLAVPAAAHEHATGVVKDRMELMEGMAKRMKAIRERIDRKRDLPAIKADAAAIAEGAPHIVHLFPSGSTQRPTDARAIIWQNWPDFERLAKALEVESQKLAGMDGSDLAAISAQERAVSQTCAGCHEKYRVKRRRQ
jgi:cytochrome c556